MLEPDDILNSGIFDFPVFPLSENLNERGRGDNDGHLLVCLSGADSPDLQIFLEKIMASVQVDLNKDAFTVPTAGKEKFRFSSLDHRMRFANAIFFGLLPAQVGLNLNVQKYQPITFKDHTFLFADSLETIQNQPEFKRPLWEALKKMFVK